VTVNQILVDTSAWVALFDKSDKYYREATAFWRYVQSHHLIPLTHDYIMDETYTMLRNTPNGLLRATHAHQIVEQSKWIQLVEVNQEYRKRGWVVFQNYHDKVFSFTDCVSFGMMHSLGIYQAFTFDEDFARASFVMRP
jgi:predicted nucleic acid-binding protein